MAASARDKSVFVNCPFDAAFTPLFDGLQFTVAFCGFKARSALEVNDSGELRLSKIVRLIEGCRLSIHDISRVESDAQTGLPRFNMPIELGIAIGMKHLGRAQLRDHALLVLDHERYRYQRFASDLAGLDIAAHSSALPHLIDAVRNFLRSHSDKHLPGTAAIASAHALFEAQLPSLAHAARQTVGELTYADRLLHIEGFIETLV